MNPVTFDLSPDKIHALLSEAVSQHFTYGLGFKIVPIDLQGDELIGTDANGVKAKKVDCSGFVEWVLFHASGGKLQLPEGSVNQHEWAKAHLKALTVQDGHNADGSIMLAFLAPESTSEGIGHVMIVCRNSTIESFGGNGPGSRLWGSHAFMAECDLYLLTPA